MRDEIRRLRQSLQAADNTLYAQQNRQRAKQARLLQARRRGPAAAAEAAALEQELAALGRLIERTQANRQALRGQLAGRVGELVLPQTPQQLAGQLDDRLPCLLLPVRVETRFMGAPGSRELWVRVYPDDIAVHTHEPAMTRDEAAAGVDCWMQRRLAAEAADPAERQRLAQGAWRALAGGYGRTRAAWICAELERRATERDGGAGFDFLLLRAHMASLLTDPERDAAARRGALLAWLDRPHPLVALVRERVLALLQTDEPLGDETRQAIRTAVDNGVLEYLGFGEGDLKAESWSRAPRTEVMPDRFVLVGLTGSARLERPFPNAVPNPLILGPDPLNLETELSQQAGDLVLGDDYAWLGDFEQAIAVGMGLRLPLPEPFSSRGFDRLLVLGLRVSAEPADSAAQVEALLNNHHYAPDGLSLVPQGTPTNHTSAGRAGAAEAAPDDAGFALETQGLGLQATADELKKTDAQRLAEAWDVRLETFDRVAHADQQDVSQARHMNRALWPATLGFYLEELLELEPAVTGRLRAFFTEAVAARGSLPALRVGRQPYGVLVTSACSRWEASPAVDGDEAAFLGQVAGVLKQAEVQWRALAGQVSHVAAPGDSFAHLLNVLGLQASSVDFTRRVGTYQAVLWNLAHLLIGGNFGGNDPIARYFHEVTSRGIRLLADLGLQFPKLPKLFGLLFSQDTAGLNSPVVDDVATPEDEVLSEVAGLPARYAVAAGEAAEAGEARNYIGWLLGSGLNDLKQQAFTNPAGEALPAPAALLYRLLHRSLLLAHYAATMDLYERFAQVHASVRAEQTFINVEAGRTVTRWEFMEARVREVLPQLGQLDVAVGDFVASPAGQAQPAALTIADVRASLAALEPLSTAALERLLAEHIDLCSYRLDAWQTALFTRRLERLNALRRERTGEGPARRGLHLGAYGWLEEVRPAAAAARLAPDALPEALREEGVAVFEQPGNAGYIHAPSINHAVAAAVLRNAYLTHAGQAQAEHFAVRLSSERVRTALAFLDGVRNGQELGALLGYQFERALHDRYVVGGQALSQFIRAFRQQYPLVADKITPGDGGEPIIQKEAYQVVDGYALLEAVFLNEPPLTYPYNVAGLPANPADPARQAIEAEVARLEDTLDAIADLLLAEGVYQVTQGNHERAGAVLKSLAEGNAPPEPEIVRTPRSGTAVHHRVAVHFETGNAASPWSGPPTPRALAAPGLNQWLGELIGAPETVAFGVAADEDGSPWVVSLAELGLQPLDLALLVGDEAGASAAGRPVSGLTELEARIDFAYRLKRQAADPAWDGAGRATIRFMSREGFPAATPPIRTYFELLPLLRALRNLVTASRPLGANDYRLPAEASVAASTSPNPHAWDLDALKQVLNSAALALQTTLGQLGQLIAAFPPNALDDDAATAVDLGAMDYAALRGHLVALAGFGLPDAFPRQALLPPAGPPASEAEQRATRRSQQAWLRQALQGHAQGTQRAAQAAALLALDHLTPAEQGRLTAAQTLEIFQQAARLLLGDAFPLIPSFVFPNRSELEAAEAFAADPDPSAGLLRFTHQRLAAQASSQAVGDWRPLAVQEWLQGVAAVRAAVGGLDQVQTYQAAFGTGELSFQPVQLPFDERAHWIAVEYPAAPPEAQDDPAAFVPSGEFLSVVRHVPSGYSSAGMQSGLLVDEWNEVIPNRRETTGIAVHYNQPNTEPPQCVLLAVSPVMRGAWTWDDLVATVVDTFDRARQRAVEPDLLRATPYAQLLPAVLTTFTRFPLGTLSTDLAASPEAAAPEP